VSCILVWLELLQIDQPDSRCKFMHFIKKNITRNGIASSSN